MSTHRRARRWGVAALAAAGSLLLITPTGGTTAPAADAGAGATVAAAEPLTPGWPKSDFNGDGAVDLIARDTVGRLYLYMGNGEGDIGSRIGYGYGWNAMTAIVAVGNWNGDDTNDLIARESTGRLYLYPGKPVADWAPRVAYGTGWNAMHAIVGPGDFDGDGNPDLFAAESTGRLWLYPGDGSGGWLPRVGYGYGWNAMTSILGIGDFNTDGHRDLAARDGEGRLWLYRGDGAGGFAGTRVLIGTGWQNFTALVAPWDLDGDGFSQPDILARTSTGDLYLFRGDGHDYWNLPAIKVGWGWNGMTAIVS